MSKNNHLEPGEERRDQIIRIAMERFATQGYHQTKISDIVREAGVAQGTFTGTSKVRKPLPRRLW